VNDFVLEGLDQIWSPEIIVMRWKKKNPGAKLSPSTIYRAFKQKTLPKPYTAQTHLRHHGKSKNSHNSQSIKPDHKISERPAIVETRTRLGDLEGDTVYGGVGKGCALTLVDRTSRYLYATVAHCREKQVIKQAFARALGGAKVASITLDNGSEFAAHREIAAEHNTTIYFADPHSPWQRGSNENLNGLLRFFYPKGTDFKNVSEKDFQKVVSLINNRPRKCLGWLSPIEFLQAMCCT
jgi:IS30 family transposase